MYWARPHPTGIVRASFGGGAPVSLAPGELEPFALAADTTGIYWMTTDGKLRRYDRKSAQVTTKASGFNGAFADLHIQAIALTSTFVVLITNDGKVMRIAK